MSDFGIGAIDYTVVDVVSSLARLYINPTGPPFLMRPKLGLSTTLSRMERGKETANRALVQITGTDWPYKVALHLSCNYEDPRDWVALGPFMIFYFPGSHLFSRQSAIARWLEPSYIKSETGKPMRYRIRTSTQRMFDGFWPLPEPRT